jgi:UDP-N-acetylmuramoyl-tripeptide--D-alanyl-D-alanine ligase
MKFLNTQWISRALNQNPSEREAAFTQITSDTRQVKKGSVFVALKGENTDGHQFIHQAKQLGATACVHLQSVDCPKEMISFPLEDTLSAWRLLAKAWRKEFSIPVVAVAGSAGKTTSKELLAALFRGRWKNVLSTAGSQNGFQGVPTTLLRIQPETEAAVIEVGIDEPGAMIQHLDLVHPDAGLLTSIGPEHLEKLIDLETVEKEEGLLFGALEKNSGFAAINIDDERIYNQSKILKNAQQITYSLKKNADVRGSWNAKENTLSVTGISSLPVVFPCPLEGAHNALNLLGAVALAHGLAISPIEMQEGLKSFTPPPGRSELHQWKGCKVFADFYNSNPASVVVAIETLTASRGNSGKTILCLGDMLEMGALEEKLHRDLADSILSHHIESVFLYGPRMKHLENELINRKYSGIVKHFSTHESLAREVIAQAKSNDRILIKGSRGMKMENVWNFLRNE